ATDRSHVPFVSRPSGYHYADNPKVVGPLLQCWPAPSKPRLFLVSPPGPLSGSVPDYKAYIADHKQWFADTGADLPNGWSLIAVAVPTPTDAECAQVSRAAAP